MPGHEVPLRCPAYARSPEVICISERGALRTDIYIIFLHSQKRAVAVRSAWHIHWHNHDEGRNDWRRRLDVARAHDPRASRAVAGAPLPGGGWGGRY